MNLQLTNQVILLTAATDGLGLAAATQLVKEGAKVAVCGRNKQRNQQALDTLLQFTEKNNVLVQQCDITNIDDIQAFVTATAKRFGQIDGVITNAGGPPKGSFESANLENYQQGFELTLMSVVHTINAALPYLKKSTNASILTITSIAVKQPLSGLYISNIIRPAVVALTKALSQEHGKDGIRANSILPGWTATDHVNSLLTKRAELDNTTLEAVKQNITSDVPLKRMATPEEFGNVATFLISPAASYINGAMLQVDGGLYKGLL
jgi:3-oxoacyl-[acyl-carrier protein] reductase